MPIPQTDDLLDDEVVTVAEAPLSRFTRRMMVVSFLALWSPFWGGGLLSAFSESFRFMEGIRPMAYRADLALYLLGFAALVHIALAFPLTQFSYPQIRNFPRRWMRVGTLFALIALPLFSFAYYKTIAGPEWILEAILATVPAAFLAALYYERYEKRWLITWWTVVGAYVPLYLLNDLMGPFATFFAYASRLDLFYWLRYAGPALAIAFTLFGLHREAGGRGH